MLEIPAQYYNQVKRITQATFNEHALGNKPWGMGAPNNDKSCLYRKGCAIGMSLTDAELKSDMDAQNLPGIDAILTNNENLELAEDVRSALFGIIETPPAEVTRFLANLQLSHDKAARLNDRSYYRGRVEMLCHLSHVLISGRL